MNSILKNLLIPTTVLVLIIVAFLNVKNLPFNFSDTENIVLRYAAKFLYTIILPLGTIYLFFKDKSDFGIHFPKFTDSFKLSIWAYAVTGPAGITFLIIDLLGWSFQDWYGSITLAVVYSVALYFVPKVTKKLPTRHPENNPNSRLRTFAGLSLLTVVSTYFIYDYVPVLSKVLYFIFIVGLGEELLFRGYLQSSFNRYFGKPFSIGNVRFGWGLIIASILFGLTHSLLVVPPLWPWALFTFVLGLILGYIREKDGSILSAVLLHALLDMPLVIFSP